MGFRVRRSIKIIPGVRLNLSKSGPSVSVGGKGLTYNVSKRGTRTTVGLPGTGMSYSTSKRFQKVPIPSSQQQIAKAPTQKIQTFKIAGLIFLAFLLVALIQALN